MGRIGILALGKHAGFAVLAILLPAPLEEQAGDEGQGDKEDIEPCEAAMGSGDSHKVVGNNSLGGRRGGIGMEGEEGATGVTSTRGLGPLAKAEAYVEASPKAIAQGGDDGVGLRLADEGSFSKGKSLHVKGVGLPAVREGIVGMEVTEDGAQDKPHVTVGGVVFAEIPPREGHEEGSGVPNVLLDRTWLELLAVDGAASSQEQGVCSELDLPTNGVDVPLQEEVVVPIHKDNEPEVMEAMGRNRPKLAGRTQGP